MGKKSRAQATTATTTMEPLLQQDIVFLGEQESIDLSYWELVNSSDADSDDDSSLSLEDGFVSCFSATTSSPTHTNQEFHTHKDPDPIDHQNSHDDHDRWFNCDEHNYHRFDRVGPVRFYVEGNQHQDANVDEEEEAEEEEEDGYGLDDELVPWHVSGKLGRQRMRKLGKRTFAKMSNSKRNPYLHVKPGCVHGKHGLGIKA